MATRCAASLAPAEEQRKRAPRRKVPAERIDAKYLAAARELRDRYMERINSDPLALLPQGKYDVARALVGPARGEQGQLAAATLALPAFPAAA